MILIRSHLHRLMKERDLNVASIVRQTGLHRNTVTLLKKDVAKEVNLDALAQLCQLLECQVNDILEFMVVSDESDNCKKDVISDSESPDNGATDTQLNNVNYDNWTCSN